MTDMDPRLIVLSDEASALIRAEVRAAESRHRLEMAVRDAVRKLGASTDEVSAVTGLPPSEVYRILATPAPLDSIESLAGLAPC